MHPTWYVKILLRGVSVVFRIGSLETRRISSTTAQEKAPVPMCSILASLLNILILRVVSHVDTCTRSVGLTAIGAEHLVNFSGEESKKDDVGHGTHVAGTIGSRTYELYLDLR